MWAGLEEEGSAWEALEAPPARDIRNRAPRSQASPRSQPPQARAPEGRAPLLPQLALAVVPAWVRPHRCPRSRQSSTTRCLGNLGIGRCEMW